MILEIEVESGAAANGLTGRNGQSTMASGCYRKRETMSEMILSDDHGPQHPDGRFSNTLRILSPDEYRNNRSPRRPDHHPARVQGCAGLFLRELQRRASSRRTASTRSLCRITTRNRPAARCAGCTFNCRRWRRTSWCAASAARSGTWRWTSASGSPTFGRWVGVELSAENFRQLYVPIGFAHGFCVLSDEAEVLYKISARLQPGARARHRLG